MLPSHLRQIAERFALEGEYLSAHPYGEGHINDTLRVVTTGGQYVLQRISTAVFPHPEQVMENIENVIHFLTQSILAAIPCAKPSPSFRSRRAARFSSMKTATRGAYTCS